LVRSISDINGDNVDDILVTAPGHRNSRNRPVGRVYAISGSTSEVIWTHQGNSAFSEFATAMEVVGDVTGDGIDDIAVSAPRLQWFDPIARIDLIGAVLVLSGVNGELIYTFRNRDQLSLDYNLPSDRSYGESLSALGDINGDGWPEFIVGHNRPNAISASRTGAGNAIVYSLRGDWDNDGYENLSDPVPLVFTDETTDVDLDGVPDLVEFALGSDVFNLDSDGDGISDGDEVNIYGSNPASNDSDSDGLPDGIELSLGLNLLDPLDAEHDLDSDGLTNVFEFRFTTKIDVADTDGDTLSDGEEYSNIGRTHPLRSDTDGDGVNDAQDLQNDWLYFYNGNLQGQGLINSSLSEAHNTLDRDGDGVADFVLQGDGAVISGATGAIIQNQFSSYSSIASGDINGDGTADMIIGRVSDLNGIGESLGLVSVFSGVDQSLLFEVYGDLDRGDFGSSIDVVGDVNDDGYVDILVGAPALRDGTGQRGSALLLSGFNGETLHTFTAGTSSREFGNRVLTVGDIDDDGVSDVAISTIIGRRHSVYLYSGKTGQFIDSVSASTNFTRFGSSMDVLGDINDDGYPDFIVGRQRSFRNPLI